MKKTVSTMLLVAVLPLISRNMTDCFICNAEEVDIPQQLNWPEVSPVYNSYYDQEKDLLFIYGEQVYTSVEIKVVNSNRIVLFDVVNPYLLPTIYDFTKEPGGTYQVIISMGGTIIRTFCFDKN